MDAARHLARGGGVSRRRAATVVWTLGAVTGLYYAARFSDDAGQQLTIDDPPAVHDPLFGRVIETLTGAPVRDGNVVDVLRNGCRFFPAMLDAIRSAQHTVDFQTYVYWTGDIATQFASVICERARSGVEVNVLLDAVGAKQMDRSLIHDMQGAGATVVWFRPPTWRDLHKLDNRTHRKILVVDGAVGFTGGAGIAAEWTGDAQDAEHWRDTHVRVEGPVVRELLGGFQENWSEATGRVLGGPHLPHLDPLPDGVRAQACRSSAAKGVSEAEELYRAAMGAARERLWVTSAYFAPRKGLVDDLVAAAGRGVDVRLLVNGARGDKDTVRQTGRRSYARLLDGGVRIFEYQPTMLHAKVMTVDGSWSTVGSINLDNRSFALNDELNLVVTDPRTAGRLDRDFDGDLADSREIEPGEWHDRTLRTRAREQTAATLRAKL